MSAAAESSATVTTTGMLILLRDIVSELDFLDCLDGLLQTVVAVAHNAVVVFDAEEVAGYERFEHIAKVGVAVLVDESAAAVFGESFLPEAVGEGCVGEKLVEVLPIGVGVDSVVGVGYGSACDVVEPGGNPFAFDVVGEDVLGACVAVEFAGDGCGVVVEEEAVEVVFPLVSGR